MKAKLFCSPCRIISAANNIRQPGKETKVCLAKLGNDAGLIGAALLGKQTMV